MWQHKEVCPGDETEDQPQEQVEAILLWALNLHETVLVENPSAPIFSIHPVVPRCSTTDIPLEGLGGSNIGGRGLLGPRGPREMVVCNEGCPPNRNFVFEPCASRAWLTARHALATRLI